MFIRMIKPGWARPALDNGNSNPEFKKEIEGPNVIEGCSFTDEFISSKNQEGYNVYFFPNHPSTDVYEKGVHALAGKHIDVFNYVFVDMDLKDKVYETTEDFLKKVGSFPIKPTMTIKSGHGVHVYWKITDLTRDAYVFLQVGLLKHFKTDESIYTVLQLMRLPGSINTKQLDAPVQTEVLSDFSTDAEYSLETFTEVFKILGEDDIKKAQRHLDRLDGKITVDPKGFANIDEIPEKFLDFIEVNKFAKDLWERPKEIANDRSAADMKLANLLLKNNFNKKEALAVIANTQKALSHGNRQHYADITISKVYTDKLNSKFKTVGDYNRNPDQSRNLGELVNGPISFDTGVLGSPWRKRELMGLIAGTGVGKSTCVLQWMKEAIENNPLNDDIFVFFSLEMAAGEIVERWNRLVGSSSPLADRLYVIGNEDEKFEPRNIGLQEILEDCQELKKLTGKNIKILTIDHIGILSRHIDIRKKHTFGIDSEQNAGYGDIKTISLNSMCNQLKSLCKMLDTFIVVLTQTTKEKGIGDKPIDKDGAYGISNYENIMDRIITLWQPLKLVQSQTQLRVLAWQYVKVRDKRPDDKISTNEPKLMTFNLENGALRPTTPEEYTEFNNLLPKVHAMKEAQLKNKGGIAYSIMLPPGVLERFTTKPKETNNNDLGQVQLN